MNYMVLSLLLEQTVKFLFPLLLIFSSPQLSLFQVKVFLFAWLDLVGIPSFGSSSLSLSEPFLISLI